MGEVGICHGFAMNSHSHPMYGSVTAWFYKYLAGISAVEPGFKRIRIRPYMPEGLNRAEGEINTPYGVVLSGWEKSDKGYTLKINVPASCEAGGYSAGGARMTLREGNTALEKARGILKAEAVSGDMRLCLVYEAGDSRLTCLPVDLTSFLILLV